MAVGSKTPILSDHPIHPWYGPCDGFADGECSECLRAYGILAGVVLRLRTIIDDRTASKKLIDEVIEGLALERQPERAETQNV